MMPEVQKRPCHALVVSWRPPLHIRAIVIGVIWRGDELLVYEGYDRSKDETFYRPLGGGIDFGEAAVDALAREFREEIGTELDGCATWKRSRTSTSSTDIRDTSSFGSSRPGSLPRLCMSETVGVSRSTTVQRAMCSGNALTSSPTLRSPRTASLPSSEATETGCSQGPVLLLCQ